MKEELRQATKAQANAVREYLQELGVALTHTQALEVIARGQGLRSRHALADQIDKAPVGSKSPAAQSHGQSAQVGVFTKSELRFTRVAYRYVDGSNCKRFSQMLFRGRLTVDQLKLIRAKLDDGLYFVPAQVGFENLVFAFGAFDEEDHGWHTLELGDPSGWEVDSDGYVLRAGDVEQVFMVDAPEFATDADCDNLFWRFASLHAWAVDEQTQLVAKSRSMYSPHAIAVNEASAKATVEGWLRLDFCQGCTPESLHELYVLLCKEGFEPRAEVPHCLEWTRRVTPLAYQFVTLRESLTKPGTLELDSDVSTFDGDYLTSFPLIEFGGSQDPMTALSRLNGALFDQRKQALFSPHAWLADLN